MPRLVLALEQQRQQRWQGPYPPPEAVERFERLLPGSFARIMAMAEQSQAAQIAALDQAQRYLQFDTRRGSWLGFACSIAAMLGALVCVALHQPWVAAAFVGVPAMAVAKALVQGSHRPAGSEAPDSAPQRTKTPAAGPGGGQSGPP